MKTFYFCTQTSTQTNQTPGRDISELIVLRSDGCRVRTSTTDLARSVPPMGQYGSVGPVALYQSASCPSVTACLVSGQCVGSCQENITRLVLAGGEGAEQHAQDAQSG